MIRRVVSYLLTLLLGVGIAVIFGRGLPELALLAIIAGSVAVVAGLGWLLLRRLP